MRSRSAILATFWLILTGCGGSGSSTTAPPSSLSVTIATSPIVSGTSVQASATLINGSGGSSPATSVTWFSSNDQVASVSSTGLITGAIQGNATIRATSAGLTGELNVTVIPGAPARIIIFSGNGQSAAKGSSVADPLCTNVLDAAGNWIIGATVTYVVSTGGGQVGAPTAPVTNGAGIAISGAWTLGPSAGTQTVTASSAGAGSVVFSATAQ